MSDEPAEWQLTESQESEETVDGSDEDDLERLFDEPLEEDPSDAGAAADDEPLSDLTRRIRERRKQKSEEAENPSVERDASSVRTDEETVESSSSAREATQSVEDDETLFEEVDVGELDADDVWQSVIKDSSIDAVSRESEHADSVDASERDHIVPKSNYCESCHFFSAPPTVACTYEGSEIVEIVDAEQFRVRNCPVVAGQVSLDGTSSRDRVDDFE